MIGLLRRVPTGRCGGLGQQPPGRVEMSSSSPVQDAAGCSDIDGQLFDQGRLCCNKIQPASGDAYYYCRSVSKPSAPSGPTTPGPGITIPGLPGYQPPGLPGSRPYMPPTQAGTIFGMSTTTALLGAAAIAVVGVMLSRRAAAPAPAPIIVSAPAPVAQPVAKEYV